MGIKLSYGNLVDTEKLSEKRVVICRLLRFVSLSKSPKWIYSRFIRRMVFLLIKGAGLWRRPSDHEK